MSLIPKVRNCTHIKVTGVRCGSPAMRDEQFCYFHQRMLRSVKTPPNVRLHPIALIENEEAIQASLMEVINALARNHIDLRRADLILRALYIAVKNSRRARFNVNDNQMVREVPDYPAPALPSVNVNVLALGAAAGVGVSAAGIGVNVGSRLAEGANPASPTTSVPAEDWFAVFGESEMPTVDPTEVDTSAIDPTVIDPAVIDPTAIDPTQRKPPARAGLPAERKINKIRKKR
jgi:hypothetical protein